MDNDVMTLFPELSENTGWTNFDDVDAIFGPKYETLPTDDMLPSNPTVCHNENHHGLSGKMLLFDDSTTLPLPSRQQQNPPYPDLPVEGLLRLDVGPDGVAQIAHHYGTRESLQLKSPPPTSRRQHLTRRIHPRHVHRHIHPASWRPMRSGYFTSHPVPVGSQGWNITCQSSTVEAKAERLPSDFTRCPCGTFKNGGRRMIQWHWLHAACVGFNPRRHKTPPYYVCATCMKSGSRE
ncbi:hypothetical protein BDV33DRAFT_210718 [Aspergillus novoparasiticus]|uniref:Uncharacterized protein n=1 Tax=Aspergillus novoparasiticus TaxID=986946 RepID=A0A5N6E713_9EURO|nr:hypothetical protein BDV33DRAFT_210718 [Aspergillus novoparasiticus]